MSRLADLRFTAIDVRLAFRMLRKHPGLTVVGGVAFAFAIWLSASAFELVSGILNARLPGDETQRVVTLQVLDARTSRAESQVTYDLVRWRRELRTVRELGAYRDLSRNLITRGEVGDPVRLAEISVSGFGLLGVQPLLGRVLAPEDERPGAPAVVVIGEQVWERVFSRDPQVLGREVRLGRTPYTVVGVMPGTFGFPVSHQAWTPLRLDDVTARPRAGASVQVVGRLAPDMTLEDATAEVAAYSERLAAELPETHRDLRLTVQSYARAFTNLSSSDAMLAIIGGNLPVILFVVLILGNIALLMFARTASREGELAVRTALGASRGRIVMQLFVEALVLGIAAAAVGLAAAGFGLRWLLGTIQRGLMDGAPLPYWFDWTLDPATIAYASLVTVVGALIVGAGPALRVTRGLNDRLKQTAAGGGGLRIGGVWTVVIVAQVAVTVAFPSVAYFTRRDARTLREAKSGIADERFLSARLEMDREPPPDAPSDTSFAAFTAHYERTVRELEDRLRAHPEVADVTFAERLPRMYHPHRLIEVDSGGAAPMRPEWPGYRVSSALVDPGFFRAVDAPILGGRDFHSGDAIGDGLPIGVAGAREGTVIVNEPFVRLVLGGRNAIGRRIRYVSFEDRFPRQVEERDRAPWYTIVGVVPNLGMAIGADVGQREGGDPKVAGIYHAAAPARLYPLTLGIEVHGDPQDFARTLREITLVTDPGLRLYTVQPLARANDGDIRILGFWTRFILIVSGVAVFLSLAGIYSVMAFTLSRRTREIGIRVALGASPRRVLLAVFRRPLRQVSAGLVVGGALTTLIVMAVEGFQWTPSRGLGLGTYLLVMVAVCLIACVVPARRALAIEPSEALRSE